MPPEPIRMSGSWMLTVHLLSQSGGQLRWKDDIAGLVPHVSARNERSVGAAAGRFTLAECLAGRHEAGSNGHVATGSRWRPRALGKPRHTGRS
jgi:sarcosine oxidase subunit alpha